MKLQDNSVFWRVVVVPVTAVKFRKTQRFIEIPGSVIGFSHLQVDRPAETLKHFLAQIAGDSLAAEIGRYREIEDLALTLGQPPGNQKSRHPAFAHGDQEIVL